MEKVRTDTLWFGALAGILIPLLTFMVVYWVRESEGGLIAYIDTLYYLRILPKLLSLCLLPNLILFFVFMRLDKLRSAKGVILSLFLFAAPIITFKLL